MVRTAREHHAEMERRRTVRQFSEEPIPLEAVRECIAAASAAPSGAHRQPWTFVLVTEPNLKRQIREGAEAEERAFYGGRAGAEWLKDLEPFGTDANKPFLETCPALIVVFAQAKGPDGEKHYYVPESVGIACGFLLTALHRAGLATLTHTPSPMRFLREILGRPKHERPFLVIPVGFPADGCEVPAITRKPLDRVLVER
ncbi:MAG: nitroreductase family protein [Proteobacteria bacterium]|nr:nitroreductase family protein [Pseudomonadota bacterium]